MRCTGIHAFGTVVALPVMLLAETVEDDAVVDCIESTSTWLWLCLAVPAFAEPIRSIG